MNTCTSSASARPPLQLRRRIAPAVRQCNAASSNTPSACPCQRTLASDAALPLPDCPQASAVGDFDQAADRWRDVLRALPGRPALWRAYLAFRQTHFASFTARKLRHLHDDAMDVRVSCISCREDAAACRVLRQTELHGRQRCSQNSRNDGCAAGPSCSADVADPIAL